MPILRINFEGLHDEDGNIVGGPEVALQAHGPTIPILIGTPFGQTASNGGAQTPSPRQVMALVDTGATQSCVDITFADQLGLPAVDVQPVNGVAGLANHTVYLGQLVVPELEISLPAGRLIGVGLHTHQVIVGRDFLRQTIMIYDGSTGSLTITR